LGQYTRECRYLLIRPIPLLVISDFPHKVGDVKCKYTNRIGVYLVNGKT